MNTEETPKIVLIKRPKSAANLEAAIKRLERLFKDFPDAAGVAIAIWDFKGGYNSDLLVSQRFPMADELIRGHAADIIINGD